MKIKGDVVVNDVFKDRFSNDGSDTILVIDSGTIELNEKEWAAIQAERVVLRDGDGSASDAAWPAFDANAIHESQTTHLR